MSLDRYSQVQCGQSPDDFANVGADSGDPCDPNSVYYDPYTYDCGQGDGQASGVCDPNSYFYDPNDPSCNVQYDPICDELVALSPKGTSTTEYYNPPLVPENEDTEHTDLRVPGSENYPHAWYQIDYQSGGPNYLGEGPDGLLYPLKFAMSVNAMKVHLGLKQIQASCPFYSGVPADDYQQIAGWDMIPISSDVSSMGASSVTRIVARKKAIASASSHRAAGRKSLMASSLKPGPGTKIPPGIKFIYRRKKPLAPVAAKSFYSNKRKAMRTAASQLHQGKLRASPGRGLRAASQRPAGLPASAKSTVLRRATSYTR